MLCSTVRSGLQIRSPDATLCETGKGTGSHEDVKEAIKILHFLIEMRFGRIIFYPPKVTPLIRYPTGSAQSRSLPEVHGSDSQQGGHCRHHLLL